METALTPCRVLDPSYGPDSGDYSFVAYGTTATVHWHITDLLLWEQVGQTRGPLDVAYADAGAPLRYLAERATRYRA